MNSSNYYAPLNEDDYHTFEIEGEKFVYDYEKDKLYHVHVYRGYFFLENID